MSMILFKHKGNFSNTLKFFNKLLNKESLNILDRYGKLGVKVLAEATPKREGKTANSWDYEVKKTTEGLVLTFLNTNINDGINVAVLIQYGHGVRGGGYVEGIDYINPALRPVFEALSKELWEELMEV